MGLRLIPFYAVFLILALSPPHLEGAEPRRVLLLHSFDRDFAPFNVLSGSLRTTLVSQSPEPVDVIDVTLDSARFGDTVQEGPLIDFLLALFSEHRLDLVIPIGGPATQFSQRHRQRLFPNTPMLIAGTDQRLIQRFALGTNDAVVAVGNQPVKIVETILQLLPQTAHIAVVIGNSPLERFWLGELRTAFSPLTNQVDFIWLNDLSFAKMLQRCATLPPRSAVFYALLAVDAEGVPYIEERVLSQLHAVSKAPLFGLHDTQLGRGIVGGPLMAIEDISRNTAKAAVRILGGERPSTIQIPTQVPAIPRFDWRELQRWGISEANLPPGSKVEFRQPTFWELHWRKTLAVLLFCCLQTALIISLLVNRAKRRQGEAVATLVADLSSKFINLPPSEVDREIEDAQRKVCECLGLDLSALWQWSADTPPYLRLSHLYRPQGGPPTPERFDSRDTFPWCLKQLLDGKIVAVSSMESLPPEAARDRDLWHYFGIKSNLTFPLSAGGGQVIGALGFNTTRVERSWPDAIMKPLQLVAQIFANALARQMADQSLRESEARLNLAADSAEAGLWELDCRTQAFWATDKARRLFEFAPDEFISMKRLQRAVHPDDWSLVQISLERCVQAREPIKVEYRVRLSDGRIRWIGSRGRLHSTSADKSERVLGVSIDITEQRRAELEAQELRGNLTHLTRVNSLSVLSGSLAHELNQPLGIILSNAQAAQELLLQAPPDISEVQAILSDIVTADRRAGEVIDRLRSMLKRGHMSLQPVPLNQIIEEVLRLIKADLIGRGITVACTLAPDLPPVAGDRVQLQQLVLNLILNGADAMAGNPPGTRRLHLQTMLHQDRVRASVWDEGCGLPQSVERLFEPFYTTKPHGLGMGLTICRSIVNAHSGRLWAEPHPERGAVFWFELPIADEKRGERL